VIGYIELATPFFVNKARAAVLDAPFAYDGITWERWNADTLRKYIHVLVRVSRTVVYPEFRGLGVGQLLVKHAARFAKRRWQVAGYLPLFLEISADMLKYVPFAERAGMTFVGETEGNLHRVARDMEYLLNRFGAHRAGQTAFEETSGICDQQVARKDVALRIMEREGLTQGALLAKLRNLSRDSVLREFALFHDIVTLPKPHYMLGLRRATAAFLKKRVEQLAPRNGLPAAELKVAPLTAPIVLSDVSLSYLSRVRRTASTHMVQQAFGISPDYVHSQVIRDLTVRIDPGMIVLVVGPSGSGKTSLLNAIRNSGADSSAVEIRGAISLPASASVGSFCPISSKRPLIEVLGTRDVRTSLSLLGIAGLSEAFLYLKRFALPAF